jgi:spermidine synthase
VIFLLFGSGLCALLYQTTWLREFRLVFGASTAANAAVLGIFMAGLGSGSLVLGAKSENKDRPLRFYAMLELAIAVTAGLTPFLLWGARALYVAVGGTAALGIGLGTVVRLLLAAVIIGPPTFLMGGTLPAAARAVVLAQDTSRRAVGALYGANTLGAVAGALAGTFYLFERLGNKSTLWVAAATNVVIALIALQLSRTSAGENAGEALAKEALPDQPRDRYRLALLGAGLVGFVFFLMETVWYRMLSPIIGSTTFCFGLILAIALLGIGAGGLAYRSVVEKRAVSWNFLAVTCAAEAFFMALPYALGDRLAAVAMLLWPMGSLGFSGHLLAWTAICGFVVFPTAFFAGLQFPVLIGLLGEGKTQVGRQTGAAYAWNTAGALLGSLAGGFGFLPLFTAPGVWKLSVLLLCLVGALALFQNFRDTKSARGTLIPALVILLSVAFLGATGPTAFWRHSQIGVGRLKNFQSSPNKIRELISEMRRKLLWEADGVESSVALSKEEDGLAFIVNGRADGNAKSDAGMQVMFGLIGAALHPHPVKAMVVGLGTGSTAGWLGAVPSIQKVDVVELERAILKVAQECSPVNHDVLANPKVRVLIGDARERLLTSNDKYDLIASEPSNPYRAGVAGLFTREFYQAAQDRLEPGGFFLQWVQAYEVDDATIATIYRTLGSVFPYIETWQPQDGDLVLVASREPIRYDAERLRAALAVEPFSTVLPAVWRGNSLEDFVAHFIADPSVAKAVAASSTAPLNTDDQTVIEFAFARSVDLLQGFQVANLRAAAQAARSDRPKFDGEQPDWARVEEARLSMNATEKEIAQLEAFFTPAQRHRADAFASYNTGDLSSALRHWREQSEEPTTLAEIGLVADCYAAQGNDSASAYLAQLARSRPADAEAINAHLLLRQNRVEEAGGRLRKFFDDAGRNPWAARELITRAILMAAPVAYADPSKSIAGELDQVLASPLCVYANEENRLLQRVNLGVYLDSSGPGERTRAAIEAMEPNVPWQAGFLSVRKTCYEALHDARASKAARDLAEFSRLDNDLLGAPSLAPRIEASKAAENADAGAGPR